MFNKRKSMIFSQGMVELEQEMLSKKECNFIKNSLACIMLKMTKTMDIVKTIMVTEKEIIKKRGCEGNYLFNKELVFEDVVSFYYDSTSLLEDGKREFNVDLTLSELLLLAGVFNSILNSHTNTREEKECEYSKLFNKTSRGTIDKKEQLLTQICEEQNFISYLTTLNDLILGELANYLGFEFKESLFLEDFNLSKSIDLNTTAFPLVQKEIVRRENSSKENVEEDFSLLSSCGDNSKDLSKATSNSFNLKEKIYS